MRSDTDPARFSNVPGNFTASFRDAAPVEESVTSSLLKNRKPVCFIFYFYYSITSLVEFLIKNKYGFIIDNT